MSRFASVSNAFRFVLLSVFLAIVAIVLAERFTTVTFFSAWFGYSATAAFLHVPMPDEQYVWWAKPFVGLLAGFGGDGAGRMAMLVAGASLGLAVASAFCGCMCMALQAMFAHVVYRADSLTRRFLWRTFFLNAAFTASFAAAGYHLFLPARMTWLALLPAAALLALIVVQHRINMAARPAKHRAQPSPQPEDDPPYNEAA